MSQRAVVANFLFQDAKREVTTQKRQTDARKESNRSRTNILGTVVCNAEFHSSLS